MTEMTPQLHKDLIEGARRAAAGRNTEQLVTERDKALVAILRAIKDAGFSRR